MSKQKSKRAKAKASKRKADHVKKRNVKRQDAEFRADGRVKEQQLRILRATGNHADWGKHTASYLREQDRHTKRNKGTNVFLENG